MKNKKPNNVEEEFTIDKFDKILSPYVSSFFDPKTDTEICLEDLISSLQRIKDKLEEDGFTDTRIKFFAVSDYEFYGINWFVSGTRKENKHEREKRLDAQRKIKAKRQEIKKEKEQIERQEYERLKAKFEK